MVKKILAFLIAALALAALIFLRINVPAPAETVSEEAAVTPAPEAVTDVHTEHIWVNGICTVCGTECVHEWQSGICTVCGAECAHEWQSGICTVCGTECTHEWQSGICTVCGTVCAHEMHGQSDIYEAPVCSVCGERVCHNWVNSICTVCGEEFTFIEEQLPSEIVSGALAAENGTVETFDYASHYYSSDYSVVSECTKQMTVYTPPGYTEDEKYDLILMIVGNAGKSTLYLDSEYMYFDTVSITGASGLFDTLISNGLCKPFVAVTIEYRRSDSFYDMSYAPDAVQVECELKNDILPLLCEKYSLYPENAEAETLRLNRQHLAFYGVSYGSYLVHRAVLENCYDIFGWYCSVSGGWEGGDRMAAAIADSDLPLYYFYSCDGEIGLDEDAPNSKNDYQRFEALSDKVTEGVNGHAGTVTAGNHGPNTWLTVLFNYTRLCFFTD